jgi:hypothetical protein
VAALEAAFVVAEAGRMDVNFTAPLRLRSDIKPGLPVGLPDGTWPVVAVGADADPASQSLRVRAGIEGQTALAVGQQFSVSLLLPAPAGALAVPPSALLPPGRACAVRGEPCGGRREGRSASAPWPCSCWAGTSRQRSGARSKGGPPC